MTRKITQKTMEIRLPKPDGKFAIEPDSAGLKIRWFFNGESGGALGRHKRFRKNDLDFSNVEDADCWRFQEACDRVMATRPRVDGCGEYYWESKEGAKEALSLANSALREKFVTARLPSWALLALKHGWTPPKEKKR